MAETEALGGLIGHPQVTARGSSCHPLEMSKSVLCVKNRQYNCRWESWDAQAVKLLINKGTQNAPKFTILRAMLAKYMYSGEKAQPLPRPYPRWGGDNLAHILPFVACGHSPLPPPEKKILRAPMGELLGGTEGPLETVGFKKTTESRPMGREKVANGKIIP